MKKYIVILVLVIMSAVGCSSTKLYVNGAPAPEHMIITTNPETGIKAFYITSIHFPFREGKEITDKYYYIPFNSTINIPNKATAIIITLRLVNEDKVYYSLWEKYDITYDYDENPYYVEHEIYHGSLSIKDFQLYCPTKVDKATYSLEIRDKQGKLKFSLGKLSYKIKKKEVDNSF